jgi:hypothetical protein
VVRSRLCVSVTIVQPQSLIPARQQSLIAIGACEHNEEARAVKALLRNRLSLHHSEVAKLKWFSFINEVVACWCWLHGSDDMTRERFQCCWVSPAPACFKSGPSSDADAAMVAWGSWV